jgi:hypothetical protein
MFYDLDSQLFEKTLEINNESKYSYCFCYLNSDIFAVGNSNGSIFIYSKDHYLIQEINYTLFYQGY